VSTYYVKTKGTTLATSGRVEVSSDNTNITGWLKSAEAIYCVAIGQDGKDPPAGVFKLQWKVSGGSFADLGSTGAVKYTTGTDLTDTNAVTSGEALVAVANMTWQDGEEIEDGVSASINLGSDYYSELQFGISFADATLGATYEFQLYNVTASAVVAVESGSMITVTIQPETWPVSDTATFKYDNRAAIADLLIGKYDNRALAADVANLRYGIRAAIADLLIGKYDNRALAADVANLRYGIRLSAADYRSFRYDIEPLQGYLDDIVNIDNIANWNYLLPDLLPVSRISSLRYAISTLIAANPETFRFSIRSLVSDYISGRYDNRALTSDLLSIRHAIRTLIAAAPVLTLRHANRVLAADTATLRYANRILASDVMKAVHDVRALTSDTLSARHSIRKLIDTAPVAAFRYGIMSIAGDSIMAPYDIREVISDTLVSRYPVMALAGEDIRFNYEFGRPVASRFSANYDVMVFTDKAGRFRYRVVFPYGTVGELRELADGIDGAWTPGVGGVVGTPRASESGVIGGVC
jgi:hypothetical protein